MTSDEAADIRAMVAYCAAQMEACLQRPLGSIGTLGLVVGMVGAIGAAVQIEGGFPTTEDYNERFATAAIEGLVSYFEEISGIPSQTPSTGNPH